MFLSSAAKMGKRSSRRSDIHGGFAWSRLSSQAAMYRTKLRPHRDDHLTARHVLPPQFWSPTSGHAVRHVSLACSVLEKSPSTSPARVCLSHGGKRSCGCTEACQWPILRYSIRLMADLPSAPAAVVYNSDKMAVTKENTPSTLKPANFTLCH